MIYFRHRIAALVVILSGNFASAQQMIDEALTERDLTVLVCYGQALVESSQVRAHFNLPAPNPRSRDEYESETCLSLLSCRDALLARFTGEQTERDGDNDGIPCENRCKPPDSLDDPNNEGRRGWNCQALQRVYYPELEIDWP